jgi:sarcosine oxidase, subunit gamma
VADPVLIPITPLGGLHPETRTIGPWTIAERVDVALASLAFRLGRDAEGAAAAAAAGVPLPPPARAEAGAPWGAFWLAPAQWMVEAPLASHEDIVAHLKPLFGALASITEQTDAWVRFDVTGDGLPHLFERLCNADLAAAPDGFATRTVIEHLGCYLIRRSARAVTLLGPRSSAGSLFHALEVAARAAA